MVKDWVTNRALDAPEGSYLSSESTISEWVESRLTEFAASPEARSRRALEEALLELHKPICTMGKHLKVRARTYFFVDW